MQGVPNLESATAKAEVSQRPPSSVSVDPIGEDPLLSGSKLPRTSQNSTPIYPKGYLKAPCIFLGPSRSEANLVAPYSDIGALVLKCSSTPFVLAP